MENEIRLVKTTDIKNKYDIIVIAPGSIKGVNIPCVLAIPENYKGKQRLTMCFNNEGGITLNQSCENIQRDISGMIEGIDFEGPVLVPILPSKNEFDQTLKNEGIDFQVGEPKQFSRECFDSSIPETSAFYRIDEQVVRIIENINSNSELITQIQELRGSEESLKFEERLIGVGHSGGGAAMLRFSLMHPEKFDTLIIGGNGDIIPTPFGKNGEKLGYPFGIKDYFELFGHEFSEEDYKKINFQFYIGDREDTKPVYDTIREENYEEGKTGPLFAPKQLADLYKSIYGISFFERFKNALQQYEIAGADIGLKIYENDCHSMITSNDFHGIIDNGEYFDSNGSEQIQVLLDRKKSHSSTHSSMESVVRSAVKNGITKTDEEASRIAEEKTIENKGKEGVQIDE